MIIIGEKLNSSIPRTMKALENHNEGYIKELIKKQDACGADFLDINTAMCADKELENMLWLIHLVKENCDCGIMLDSTDTQVIAKALPAASTREVIINSTTITSRFDQIIPLAKEYNAAVVGLPIDDEGMPHTLEEKLEKLDKLANKLRENDIADDKIYLDVLVETLATNGKSARDTLEAIRYISKKYPEMNTTCGLSNISFGLPKRGYINTAFLAAAVEAGLKSAIINIASESVQNTLYASLAVAGQDDYCMNYITYIRSQEEEG
ncbi:dihydropteroate synthase [Youxingia wuxianensis]|uniref:Dihydropteroate synthase n=1 Tax=Youxingia wuxianensis TaxID=2763678 RepID=A0A926EK92_9FIRM|nr:dihydropteroate synthase [Youxingia wuxianensis]MBC8584111.1 dihydropteroate synthase [Youxingia wuxianensis]